MPFIEKLQARLSVSPTAPILLMKPIKTEMPKLIYWYDDPFFPFSKAIISATRDIVSAYLFDFAAYMALGAAGAVALERSIAYVGQDIPKILHGSFSSADYIPMIYENALGADAATISGNIAGYSATPDTPFLVVQQGKLHPTPYPTYWLDEACITLESKMTLRVAGMSVLYTSYGDDFAQACRDALQQF